MTRRQSFTISRDPTEIEIGGEVYIAPAVISPTSLGELLDTLREVQTATVRLGEPDITHVESMARLTSLAGEAFGLGLLPESAARIRGRLDDKANPLDLLREVMPAVLWLVEGYMGAHTPSSTGNGGAATVEAAGPVS